MADIFFDETHDLADKIREAIDKYFFTEAMNENYLISNYALIAHPKYKKAIAESGIKVPVVFYNYCEEDKVYAVTDPGLVASIKEAIKYREDKENGN